MIKVTPFNNPFKPVEETVAGGVVKIIVKNGKTYKKIEKNVNK